MLFLTFPLFSQTNPSQLNLIFFLSVHNSQTVYSLLDCYGLNNKYPVLQT